MSDTQCPVCSSQQNTDPKELWDRDALSYDCPQCGKYELENKSYVNQELQDTKQLVSAWIRLQSKLGNTPPFISHRYFEEDWFKNLRNMGFPQTTNEKLDELLKAWADIVKDDYGENKKVAEHLELVSAVAGKDLDEIKGLNQLLVDLDYIRVKPLSDENQIRITAKGWQHINDLLKPSYSSDSAFIAMWYNPLTDGFREASIEAVNACGYKQVIVDDTEFNGFIMDKVITLIRQARFLIADLTCSPEIVDQANSKVTQGVRGGVYWESGMAFGLGKTVIQTCRDDACSRSRIHFDLNQYETIFWKQEELTTEIRPLSSNISDPTFKERLIQRILVTIGKGKYSEPG